MANESKLGDIAEWIRNNPYGYQVDCVRELKIKSTTVSKWWELAGGFSCNEDRVIAWRSANPEGTKKECIDFLHLNPATLKKIWK